MAGFDKSYMGKEGYILLTIYFEKIDGIFGEKSPLSIEGTTNTVTNSFGAVDNDEINPPGVCTDIF
jgi:hypothetical protein